MTLFSSQFQTRRQPRHNDLVVIPSPTFARRKRLYEIFMYAPRQDEHGGILHLFSDRLRSPLERINDAPLFSCCDEYAREHPREVGGPAMRSDTWREVVMQRRSDI